HGTSSAPNSTERTSSSVLMVSRLWKQMTIPSKVSAKLVSGPSLTASRSSTIFASANRSDLLQVELRQIVRENARQTLLPKIAQNNDGKVVRRVNLERARES